MKRLTRLRRLALAASAAVASMAAVASVGSADPTSDYAVGLMLGSRGLQYGVPLLDTERIFKSSTNVTVCDHVTGHGPVNRFCSIRNLASADQRTVNAPNNDTLYSLAWLDLSNHRFCTPHGSGAASGSSSWWTRGRTTSSI